MNGLVKMLTTRKNAQNVLAFCKALLDASTSTEEPTADPFEVPVRREAVSRMSAPLAMEFEMIVKLIENTAVPLNELKNLKDRLETETSLKVHKSLVGLPSGDDILTSADVAIHQRTNDNGIVGTIVNLKVMLNALEKVTAEKCLAQKGQVVLPDSATWKKDTVVLSASLAHLLYLFK